MSYGAIGPQGLDYDLCTYEGSRLLFRGPQVELTDPFIAFLGSTETFGKFVEHPFPDVLAAHLPVQRLNLGMINAGADAYLGDPAVLAMARNAELRVVQVLSALNQTNHFFKVHPRRNDRFVAPNDALVRLFPEVDFADFHFTKAMLVALHACSPRRYNLLCRELQSVWLKRMSQLLDAIGSPTVLLWVAGAPAPKNALKDPKDPMLVDAKMLKKLRLNAQAYVEFTPDKRLLEDENQALLNIMASPSARSQIMGPKAHEQIALALQETCVQILSRK